MINGFARRVRQVASDPVLRRWLWARATGHPGPAPFTPHVPPYLEGRLPIPDTGTAHFTAPNVHSAPLLKPLKLDLAGLYVDVDGDDAGPLFEVDFSDIEQQLALHRFAWLPLVVNLASPALVADAWSRWRNTFGEDRDGWAWHPYTASERAINIIDYGRRFGLPGPIDETVALLAQHIPAIAARLEYGGAHDTGNHLANNGRGLYRLGLALDYPSAIEIGRDILIHEAGQLFVGGMLREGSTHYHLLYLRNYLDCWLAATLAGRDAEADAFCDIVQRARAVASSLMLPGGMPLVGDISPDCPPWFLAGIDQFAGQWCDALPADDRAVLNKFKDADAVGPTLAGWHRADVGSWAGLWHVPPNGWPPQPGHGHQDMGAPALHFRGQPLFVDPGRGAYGESGDAALYRSAAVHGGLLLDGAAPYPVNKPYYDEGFRARVAGASPTTAPSTDGFTLHYPAVFAKSTVRRHWQFSETGMTLNDHIEGNGTHEITRALVTGCNVDVDDARALIHGDGFSMSLIAADGVRPVLQPVTIWSAYGRGSPGTRIVFQTVGTLSWQGTLRAEVMR